jgi:hypothetical protein
VLLSSVHDKIKIVKVVQWFIVALGIILLMVACHYSRKGISEKWSWSPNRVDMDLPAYKNNERPGAATKEGRMDDGHDNPAFNTDQSIQHQ